MRLTLLACLLSWPAMAQQAPDKALAYLHKQNLQVDYTSLAEAIQHADPAAVQALLDAGLQVGPPHVADSYPMVVDGVTVACAQTPAPTDQIAQSLDLVTRHGLPLSTTDDRGNTILMQAAQTCAAPVVEHLLALGAAADPVNKQDFTPLKMALVSGKWDVARVLVDHGARITSKESAQLFFDPPQDPKQREILARATKGG